MDLEFRTISAGIYELGWRYSALLTDEVSEALRHLPGPDNVPGKFTLERTVTLNPFDIASTALPLAELVGDPYELGEDIFDLQGLCDLVDARLKSHGLRVPTEDELEAACGGTLFPWGDEIPEGVPYPGETDFSQHRAPTESGLVLFGDPYKMELVRTCLKLGDGGFTICGASPWPAAWFSLSPSYRLTDDDILDSFIEHLEGAYVRPVRLEEHERT